MLAVTPGVLTTTAQRVDGRPIREYLGIVGEEIIIPIPQLHRRAVRRECALQAARLRVLRRLASQADARGATVVLGIAVNVVQIGVGRLLVAATGTAARL